MKTFDIDCKLVYEVNGAAEFFFQIEAARIPEHTILSESFEVTPSISVPREYLPPNSHNRSLRVHAEAGPMTIEYRARVIRHFEEPDTEARELPISELPDEVMQYLLPSRYCESDVMAGMVQRTFGHTLEQIGPSLIQRYEANLVAPLTLMAPLFTIALGVLITHDRFDLRMAVGSIVALAGVLVIAVRPNRAMPRAVAIDRAPE